MAQIVGLDLGSYSVKVVRVEARRGEFDVVAYDEELLGPSAVDGVTLSVADRHGAALARLKEAGKLEGDLFVTGLGGDTASVRTISFPFTDAKKIEAALPFELEAEIPFDLEDVVYSWTVLGPKRTTRIDVSGEVRAPETEVLVAFARREAVEEHLALLAAAGIDPRHVEFDALAFTDLFEGVFRARYDAELNQGPAVTPGGTVVESGPDAPIPAVALVDIGHRATSVCILTPERVISAHTVLHGGADATRALAREFGIPVVEAERGKRKEAFIEVLGATAQFPEQRRISEILKKAYAPIVRRLRQTFQADMSTSRVRVVKVILTGGGSRVLNLERHLSETLNVRVERGRDVATRLGGALPVHTGAEAAAAQGDVPEAACALAYALSGFYGEKTRARIDFRAGDFAWKGQLDFVRDRAATLMIWASVAAAVFLVGVLAQFLILDRQSDGLSARQKEACKAITGQEVESAITCTGIIQERISGQAGFQIPLRAAADHYLEVSRRVPVQTIVDRKVIELDVGLERVRIKGTTTDYDAVDKIVAGLKGGECFQEVEKGKARNVNESIEFNATIKLDCVAKVGDPLPEAQKLSPSEKGPPRKASLSPTRGVASPANAPEKPDPLQRLDTTKGTGSQRAADRREKLKQLRERSEQAREDMAIKDEKLAEPSSDEARAERAEKKEKLREQQEAFRKLRRDQGINPGAEIGGARLNIPDIARPMRSRDGRLPLPKPPAPPPSSETPEKSDQEGGD